jgi:hypothetical protein
MAAASQLETHCKVQGCRFSQYHTTIAHRCGTCNSYGHGQIECSHDSLKQSLTEFLQDQMPEQQYCTHNGCAYPWSHAPESHHCFRCGQRGSHSAQDCTAGRSMIRHSEIAEQTEQMGRLERSREQERQYQSQIFSDSMTEGGGGGGGRSSFDNQSATKEEEHAINMNTVDESAQVIYKKCPMCRECSNVDLNMQIYTDSPCSICMEHNKKIIFSGCKHANICGTCVRLL